MMIVENSDCKEINSFVMLLNNMSEGTEKGKKQEMTRCRFCSSVKVHVGRGSVAGRATRYEMDRSGIEPQWGRDGFRTQTDSRTTVILSLSRAESCRGIALTNHHSLTPVLKKE